MIPVSHLTLLTGFSILKEKIERNKELYRFIYRNTNITRRMFQTIDVNEKSNPLILDTSCNLALL